MSKNKLKRADVYKKMDDIRAEMYKVINVPDTKNEKGETVEGRKYDIKGDIKDIDEHDIIYELDDADIDRIQELKSEMKKCMDKLETMPKRSEEIREEMAEILGTEPYEGIENVYEHDIEYQLDDCDIDKFQELRDELKDVIVKENEESEKKKGKEAVEESAEKPVEEPAKEPVEEPAKEPVEEPAEKPVEEPAKEPVEEPAEKPVEEPAKEPVEQPVEEPVEEQKDDKEKDDEAESTYTMEFKLSRFKRFLLSLLRALKRFAKVDGKFYAKLDKLEDKIYVKAALTAGKDDKITEKGKNEPDEALKNDESESMEKNDEKDEITNENKNPDEIITSKEDILWINNKVEEMAEETATIDTENDVFYNISSEELNNYKKMTQTHNAESLPKELKSIMDKNGLEEIEGINSKRIVYADMIAKSIRKYAQEKNIDLFDEENQNRPIEDIMKDIDRKILREKTDKVSREAAEAKDKEQDSTEKNKEQMENEGEEK